MGNKFPMNKKEIIKNIKKFLLKILKRAFGVVHNFDKFRLIGRIIVSYCRGGACLSSTNVCQGCTPRVLLCASQSGRPLEMVFWQNDLLSDQKNKKIKYFLKKLCFVARNRAIFMPSETISGGRKFSILKILLR